MREVNLKALSFSIYFTYISVSGPMYAQEISASRFVWLCLGVVVCVAVYRCSVFAVGTERYI